MAGKTQNPLSHYLFYMNILRMNTTGVSTGIYFGTKPRLKPKLEAKFFLSPIDLFIMLANLLTLIVKFHR